MTVRRERWGLFFDSMSYVLTFDLIRSIEQWSIEQWSVEQWSIDSEQWLTVSSPLQGSWRFVRRSSHHPLNGQPAARPTQRQVGGRPPSPPPELVRIVEHLFEDDRNSPCARRRVDVHSRVGRVREREADKT